MDTFFNQRLIDFKPVHLNCNLPSQFQIGDDVEILIEDSSLPIIDCTIYSVIYDGNGTISYNVAIKISNKCYCVVGPIRGNMRKKGSNETNLSLIPLEKIEPLIKRSLFKIVDNKE